MKLPRLLLAAGASGSGKTLITCGLLQALVNRGLSPASFKCGPDYIDPMFHRQVIGTKSGNLDTFFTDEACTRYLLETGADGCDIAVMEGVMGYYDGAGGITPKASAYDLAEITGTPVILIVNCKGMSLSLVPYIKGFLEYKADSHIRGIIFNQMSPMLYPRMKELTERELPVQVLGYVPKVEDCVIESRHLGLVLPKEVEELKKKLHRLADILEKTLDLEQILSLANEAEELNHTMPKDPAFCFRTSQKLRIGTAMDEAFCFIYPENLRLLRQMGAELIPFSPIHDAVLPKHLDGLLLYGGYPELYGRELEENEGMRRAIRDALMHGMPCMAECGGFMYLHTGMKDMNGQIRKMAGFYPGEVFYTGKLTRFGYISLKRRTDNIHTGNRLTNNGFRSSEAIPAHEFHYYDSTDCGDAFYASKPESSRGWNCIHDDGRVVAGFPHLYYYGNPEIPAEFLQRCLTYRMSETRQD